MRIVVNRMLVAKAECSVDEMSRRLDNLEAQLKANSESTSGSS
jgi:hypothetical protein